MKITFVVLGFENLAVEYLSSSLKKNGFETELVYDSSLFDDKYYFDIKILSKFFNERKTIIKKIINTKPDLIAISVFSHNYSWSKKIIQGIKKIKNIPVILGGLHPTILPDLVIKESGTDFICVGEGEDAIVELCEKMQNNDSLTNIKNIWLKQNNKIYKNEMRPLVKNLDELPFLDKDIFEKHINISDVYMTSASRGCVNNCSYCGAGILKKIFAEAGQYYRIRSPENMISELKLAKKKYKLKTINFVDNIFTLNKNWILKFLDLYEKEIKLPYRCLTYPDFLDEDIVKKLKQSLCYQISIGVQSLNEDIRKRILFRNVSNQKIFESFRLLEKYNLKYNVDHMFGIPNESIEDNIKTLEQYIDYSPAHFSCFWLTYLPETPITKMAIHLNIIENEDLQEIHRGKLTSFHSTGSIKENVYVYKQLNALFSLFTILPKPVKKIFLKYRLFRLFVRPMFLKTLFDTLVAIMYKDLEIFYFIKYYFTQILKRINAFIEFRDRH